MLEQAPSIKITPEYLCSRDPLIRLLLKLSHAKRGLAFCLAVVLNSLLILGGGVLASFFTKSHDFVPLYDGRVLGEMTLLWMYVIPVLWVYFLREPAAILQIFQDIVQNNVVGMRKREYAGVNDFFSHEMKIFNRFVSVISVVAVTFVLVGGWLFQAVTTHHGSLQFGLPRSWWSVNPLYFWVIWMPAIFLNVYMLVWVLARRIITVVVLNKFLDSFEIAPKLFHPDQCNGLSPIGKYPIGFLFLLMTAGIWILLLTVYPFFFHQSLNLRYDTIIYMTIYGLAIPAVLIFPVWKTHQAMQRAKSQSLEAVAKQIRELLAATDTEHILSSESLFLPTAQAKQDVHSTRITDVMSLIEALEHKYSLIDKAYRTWPFRSPSWINFLIFTGLPLILSTVSTVIPLLPH